MSDLCNKNICLCNNKYSPACQLRLQWRFFHFDTCYMIKQLLTILTLGILTGLPAASFAQAPVMGTVSDYVLFSSNGAVTNSGLSHLTGNVGTNSGACTGFGNVNGVMHTSDGSTLTCAADLLSLYTQLNNAIPTFSPASNLIGNGDTLEAGVIALSGTASLNDTLFLDAENDANAVFIFKIQANMNPRHRDRIAFMRVVSGRFVRGMEVTLGRNSQRLRLAKPHSFLAQERSIVEEAFPGDIVGLYDPGALRIGDTLSETGPRRFAGIPRFAPEFFGQLELVDPLKRKALDLGLEQLAHEGVIQMFLPPNQARHEPYLGAVGMLQFEVLTERLKNEYRVGARLRLLPYRIARWVGGDPKGLAWLAARRDYPLVQDRAGNHVVLSESPWALQYAEKNAPGLQLLDVEPL
ncbi:MAG: DUF3494 domain-containing protein [Sphingobacteriales bacterium]|nr:MAG: DUF3494 domain-containing protein [Sphingobacteriales bacterium]